MSETKINASQTTITAEDIGAMPAVTSMPTASAAKLAKIYQYIGATDVNYTNGYFYKCVSDGQQPATYSWSQVDVQPVDMVLDITSNNAVANSAVTAGLTNLANNTTSVNLRVWGAND